VQRHSSFRSKLSVWRTPCVACWRSSWSYTHNTAWRRLVRDPCLLCGNGRRSVNVRVKKATLKAVTAARAPSSTPNLLLRTALSNREGTQPPKDERPGTSGVHRPKGCLGGPSHSRERCIYAIENRWSPSSRSDCVTEGDVAGLRSVARSTAMSDAVSENDVMKGYKDAKGRCILHFGASFGHVDVCAAAVEAGIS
jgi:hypothetical protein